MWEYRAQLVRVIDGDTFVLDVDCGFHITKRETIRLLGIDCPELRTAEGRRARTATVEWFGRQPLGCVVRTHRNEAGEVLTFGRWVAEVFSATVTDTDDPEHSLAGALRAGGHVKAQTSAG